MQKLLMIALKHVCWLLTMGFAITSWADVGTLTVLTYNVAGLPPIVQAAKDKEELNPLVHIPLIAERFDAAKYDVINFQEGFVQDPDLDEGPPYDETAASVGTLFYDQLTANAGDPRFVQIAPRDAVSMEGNLPRVASGLGRLSTSPFTEYFRKDWDQRAGSDALSDKGYSFARHRLAEGVFVDIYNWHSNAGSSPLLDPEMPAARAANVEELIEAINANSAGKAVIVLGDSNNLYPRSFDTIRRLLGLEEGPAGSEDLDVPLKDVWIELARDGSVPEQDDEKLNFCIGPKGLAGPECEWKDKILYRSGRDVELTALEYFVEEDFVVPGTITQLSDHPPVGANFSFGLRFNRHITNLDGDKKADLTIRRGRRYLIDRNGRGGKAEEILRFGRATDLPLLADVNGDSLVELVIRRGREYRVNLEHYGRKPEQVQYGSASDTVFLADLDGDGVENLVVRQGNRYLIDVGNDGDDPELVIEYGEPDDVVFYADLDGNDTDELIIRRGNRYLVDSGNDGGESETVLVYGRNNDIVFVADIDGNGSDDLVVRRGRRYHADTGNDGRFAEQILVYGRLEDEMLVGDMDGNGTADLVVRRGNKYRIDSGNDGSRAEKVITFGRSNDVLLLK